MIDTRLETDATGDASEYDPRPFIASAEWRFAKTMAHYNPHWYVIQRENGGPLWDEFISFLEETGRVRTYKGYPYKHVTVDDFDYWTTWGEDSGTIINRKPTAEAGWDPE